MKMKSILTQKAKFRDNEVIDFPFTEEDINKAYKSTHLNPHYTELPGYPNILFMMYMFDNELRVKMYHSFNVFVKEEEEKQ